MRSVIICGFLLVSTMQLAGCDTKTSSQPPATSQQAQQSPSASGEELFKRYCASCHPNGGNVSDPARTLFPSALKRNHITSVEDVVRIMRHPISRMIRFDESTLSDRDARAIAEYVLTAFK